MNKVLEWLKKNKKTIITASLIIGTVGVITLLTTSNVFADVGNNNSYGGGGYDSGGDYDSDGDGLFFLIYLILELIEVLLPILGPVPTAIIVLLVIAGIIYVLKPAMKHKNNNTRQVKRPNNLYGHLYENKYDNHSYEYGYDNRDLMSESEVVNRIQENDPNFSAEDMKQKASECFVALQNAWTDKDWGRIRPFESDALFNMHQGQLNEYIRNGTTNVVERINVSNSQLIGWKIDGDYEVLTIKLDTRMRDYIVQDSTQKLIEGSRGQDLYVTYRMEFIRKLGVKTEKGKEISTTNCPNCGAPTQVTSSGQCEYCQSVITNGNFSWVLNELVHWN